MNTDEIINKDCDHEHWADPGALSDGMSCPGNGNDNDASDSEEDTQGGGTGPGNVKGTKAGKGNGKASEDEKWKGKGKQKQMEKGKGQGRGYGQGKGSVGQSPGGDDISRAVALQLQTAMYKADSDTVGYVEWFCWEPEVSPAVTISSGDDTDSTEESDGKYDSEHDSHVNMLVEDEVDAPYGTDLDCNVDMERDCNDVEKEDEQEEDEHEEDEEKEDEQEEEMEEEEEEEEENEEEDEDEDDGKDPQTVGQREMVNALANDVGTMVEDQPMVLPDQGQEMCEHTQWPQLLGPAPYPQTAEPRRWPQTTETHTLGGRECSRLVTPQKTSPSEANSARSWGSPKHLGCGYGSAAAQWIDRWQQSPWCPSPQCCSSRGPSTTGAAGWLSRPRVNQSSPYRGGDGCWVRVRVWILPCLFSLFYSIYLSHWLIHASWGFWIAQGLLYLLVLYCFHFIHSIMGHRTCSIFATPGM